MGTKLKFTMLLTMAKKVIVTGALFIFVGIPLLTGAGLGLLLMLLNVVTGMMMTVFSNPVGLFLAGLLGIMLFSRLRRKRAENALDA